MQLPADVCIWRTPKTAHQRGGIAINKSKGLPSQLDTGTALKVRRAARSRFPRAGVLEGIGKDTKKPA